MHGTMGYKYNEAGPDDFPRLTEWARSDKPDVDPHTRQGKPCEGVRPLVSF